MGSEGHLKVIFGEFVNKKLIFLTFRDPWIGKWGKGRSQIRSEFDITSRLKAKGF